MKKLLSILVLGLLWSGNTFAQTIDFAVRISEPGSISSLMGTDLEIEILDSGSMSSLLGDTEKWQVVGACSNMPNITVEIIDPGSIDQAHKPNEFISIEQINSCSKFLDNLIDNH